MATLVCVLTIVALTVQSAEAISSKKGIGICSSAFVCGDTWKFSGVTWWYDWRWDQGERTWAHCPHAARDGYVPMIFNEKEAHQAKLPANAKYVLGFNEPQQKGQAEMSVEKCAQVWPLVQQKAGNRILVGPALAACDIDPDMCIRWYETFFKHCKGCRVDKIAIHGYHCQPQRMMQSIEKISRHFNRKIWLTEFSCKGAVSIDHDLNFMKTILPMLERSPYVERYAWFCNRLDKTSGFLPNYSTELMDHKTSTLSRLGKFYNEFHI
ncbi:hypothetical protein LOTGIDRAFT_172699 [Lottia gigantea]|uniref:Asl1-like glycosyl hydrolase catalytic domain-containing protein n=1 Tax=Lottia gigantea TaxID=225164 RepID=V4B1J4_LOTGI|nr:hypothetical protein LOTGIDRAFT_172699 [Lottia gigantea]ESP01176.1 hypothetical protein LOTGIDRAFT_172699 [Lottia gigantea]